MSLLPSRPDASPSEDAEPRVVDVDSEDADEMLSALSSETAREVLSALHDQPAPASELANEVDTTLQNTQYHLEKLQSAGAIEVVDTGYSEKGREMDVYAPADQPLVIFAGGEEDGSMLRTALSRLLGAVGVLAAASLLVQRLFGPGGPFGSDRDAVATGGAPADAAGTPTPTPESGEEIDAATTVADANQTAEFGAQDVAPETTSETVNATATPPDPTPATKTVDPETTTTAVDAAQEAGAGLPPGLIFFAGGLFVLAVVIAALALRKSGVAQRAL